jgi:3-hydroxyisobutyrate dehydrogenase
MTPTIAVLGLGAMGLPMARHLAQSFTIRSYDIDPARGRAAADFSTAFGSAQEAATGTDIVLLAVRNRHQLEEVLWGSDGVVPVLDAGSVILLISTIGIDAVRDVAGRLSKNELLLVDAPVSGGAIRAGLGDLLVTVGADDLAYGKALPVLEAMASTLKRVGPHPGDGQCMKTVNQLLCGIHVAAAAEALALARALGLDPADALETLGAGAAASFMLGDRGPRMLHAYDEGGADEGGKEVRSRLDTFVKDMGIVTTAARGVGVSTPLAAAAEQIYILGQAHGMAARDDSILVTLLAPTVSSQT